MVSEIENPAFGPNDAFYFIHQCNDAQQLVKIPDLGQGVIVIIQDTVEAGQYTIQLDGNAIPAQSTTSWEPFFSFPGSGYCMIDNSRHTFAPGGWLSNDQFVSSVEQGTGGSREMIIGLFNAETNCVPHGQFDSPRPNPVRLIHPDVAGRQNYSAVVSPDKREIAFLSRTQTQGSNFLYDVPELFIVSADGGSPSRIETGIDFTDVNNPGVLIRNRLLEWRDAEISTGRWFDNQ